MKTFYLLIGFLFYINTNSQNITFSSPSFRATVLASRATNTIAYDVNDNPLHIDINNDGEISYAEAANVYRLNIGNVMPIIYNIDGIEHFVNIKWLNISGSRVTRTNLTALLPNLEYLNCSGMGSLVSDLNISGLNLKTLIGNTNAAMVPYFNGTSPYGSISQFTNLEVLYCDDNNLENLDITGLTRLQTLTCERNLLTNLDLTGCNNLSTILLSENKLTSLTIVDNPNLQSIRIQPNPLLANIEMRNLTALTQLEVYNGALTNLTLSNLPSLINLACGNNQLRNLELSGLENLTGLSCMNNNITSLDLTSFSKLSYINCSNNNLESLFLKNGLRNYNNGINSIIDISNNPELKYICCDENEINDIQALANPDCNINTYCSFVPGGTYSTIQGTNKFDSDNNGCSPADPMLGNLKMKITSGTNILGYAISNNSGDYNIPLEAGTYTITPVIENSNYFITTPLSRTVTITSLPTSIIHDFCFRANGMRPNLEISFFPLTLARPGFDVTYKLIFMNKGNTTQSGMVNLNFDDAILDFISANPAVLSQSLSNLSWSFSNLQPFESKEITITFNANSPMETPAVNGDDVLNYTAAITSDALDEMPDDNVFTFNHTVVNSFDPNDKTCLEGATITPDMAGKYIHYKIRFENTGTANAENIVVKDIIDTTKFDISSLIPINGSHAFETKISNGNTVEFIFENINLPFDDANNDGYVVFKIKTKPTLVLGDSFSNSASIYFDYNFPIVTEPAVTTIAVLGTKDFEFSDYFTLYPNPANAVLNIESKKGIKISSLSIYNVLGQLVLVATDVQKTIDISSLKSGNYFIKVHSDKENSNTKFIKK